MMLIYCSLIILIEFKFVPTRTSEETKHLKLKQAIVELTPTNSLAIGQYGEYILGKSLASKWCIQTAFCAKIDLQRMAENSPKFYHSYGQSLAELMHFRGQICAQLKAGENLTTLDFGDHFQQKVTNFIRSGFFVHIINESKKSLNKRNENIQTKMFIEKLGVPKLISFKENATNFWNKSAFTESKMVDAISEKIALIEKLYQQMVSGKNLKTNQIYWTNLGKKAFNTLFNAVHQTFGDKVFVEALIKQLDNTNTATTNLNGNGRNNLLSRFRRQTNRVLLARKIMYMIGFALLAIFALIYELVNNRNVHLISFTGIFVVAISLWLIDMLFFVVYRRNVPVNVGVIEYGIQRRVRSLEEALQMVEHQTHAASTTADVGGMAQQDVVGDNCPICLEPLIHLEGETSEAGTSAGHAGNLVRSVIVEPVQGLTQSNQEPGMNRRNTENIDLEANLPQTNSEAADAEQIIAEIRRNRTETGAQRANDTDECVQLNRCQHIFHKSCLTEWFRRKADCPICRQNNAGVSNIQQQSASN